MWAVDENGEIGKKPDDTDFIDLDKFIESKKALDQHYEACGLDEFANKKKAKKR